jgi:hypothetical protein
MTEYYNRPDLTRNAAQCLLCEQVVESKHIHDLVTCKCGNISVDGGTAYARRLYKDFKTIKDLTEYKK